VQIRDRIRELRRVRASDLLPSPRNWRTHPKSQQDALRGVLAEVGYADALLAREVDGGRLMLVDGHLRAETTPDSLVPVLVLDVTEAEADKLLATLDSLAAMATADAGKLDALLRDVRTGSEAVAAMLAQLAGENPIAPPEPQNGAGGDEFDAAPEEGPTRTALGDLWLVGGVHRLLVGDCTAAENVARLMGGEKAGLCFTSPPYAQQRDYGDKIADWDALMQGAFGNLPMAADGQVLVNLGIFYRDGDWVDYWSGWTAWMGSQGWRRFGWYVWDKISAPPGDWCGRCGPAHEWIFHFNRKSREANHVVPKKPDSIKLKTGSSLRYPDGSLHTANYSPESGLNTHKIPDSVWRFHVAHTGGKPEVVHPAVYPLDLPMMGMQTFSQERDSVYDPFLGSGTTLIAAHRLNRRCYGCELEPRYADVILKRAEAENLTVEKAP
jgi:DNA modification methylase